MDPASNKHSFQPPPLDNKNKTGLGLQKTNISVLDKINNVRPEISQQNASPRRINGKQSDSNDVKIQKEARTTHDFFEEKRNSYNKIPDNFSHAKLSNHNRTQNNIVKLREIENSYKNATDFKVIVINPENKTAQIYNVSANNHKNLLNNKNAIILPVNNGPLVISETQAHEISNFRSFHLISNENHSEQEMDHFRNSFQNSEIFIATHDQLNFLTALLLNKFEIKPESHQEEDKRKIDGNTSKFNEKLQANKRSTGKSENSTFKQKRNLPESKFEIDKEKDNKARALKNNQEFRENESKINTKANEINHDRIDKNVLEKNKPKN
jgi:hypothetical protein